MRTSPLVAFLRTNAEAVHKFTSDPQVHPNARTILHRLSDSEEGPTGVKLWADIDSSERIELATLGSFYLKVLEACIQDHRITPDERLVLRELRTLLRLSDDQLLRQHSVEVETLVVSAISQILADNLEDLQEELHEVALQEALNLSYDRYGSLLSLARERLQQQLEAAREGILPAEFFRRWEALEGLDRIPPTTP